MECSPALFRALRGTFCVYKPADLTTHSVINILKKNLARDLNALPCRPPRHRPVWSNPSDHNDLPVVTTTPDLSDHTLVLGPRYVEEDFRLNFVDGLSRFSSGVLVMTLNQSRRRAMLLNTAKYIRAYHIEGEFGRATQNFTSQGRIVERSTYHHITQHKLERILCSIQAGQQRHMFNASGVDPQSQAAYELAARGLLRPLSSKAGPLLYLVQCVNFDPPHFTLELHCVNENFAFLAKLIHDIGLELKSTAVCTGARRIRYGHFNLSHALLRSQWTAQDIVANMRQCRPLVTDETLLHSPGVKQIVAEETHNATEDTTQAISS